MGTVALSITLGGSFVGLGGRVYTVVGDEGPMVRVRFVEGGEGLIRRPEHMMAQRRSEVGQVRGRRLSQREIRARSMQIDLYTLGFLATHGYLCADMPLQCEEDFVELYRKLVGEDPKHYNVVPKGVDKRAVSTKIEFGGTQEEIDDLEFGELEVHQAWVDDARRWGVYSNDFYWALIYLGFHDGREDHDVRKIRLQLSSSHGDINEFTRGLVS